MHPALRTSPIITLTVSILFTLLGMPAAAQELPPEIQMDRYMLQVDRQIGNAQFAAALRTLELIVELQDAHGLELAESFWLKRAEVAMGAGDYADAIASATRYLEIAGRGGEQYTEALELLDQAVERGCLPERMTASLESVRTCVALGADPNGVGADGRTALDWAGEREDPAIAAALVEAGADPAVAAAAATEELNLPEGRICTGDYSPDSCWMELANRPRCYVWNPFPREDMTVSWSGECSNGLAQGNGRATWYQNREVFSTDQGCIVNGKGHGIWPRRTTGRLTFSGHYLEWSFSFSAGERIVANMASDEVDSYLQVVRDDGTEIASDDDGGSGTNARVEFRVPATGQYRIRASAWDNATGSFVLSVGEHDSGVFSIGEECGPR